MVRSCSKMRCATTCAIATGERPNIKPERPDVLLHLHVEGPTALVSVDFSGESLHRRGYRDEGGRAPLKENVAAAVLLRAGWPGIDERAACCWIRCAAPAPFSSRRHDRSRRRAGADSRLLRLPGMARPRCSAVGPPARGGAGAAVRRRSEAPYFGIRLDADAVRMALDNAAQAGLSDWMHVEKRALGEVPPARGEVGLVVANPPYGERIGAESELRLPSCTPNWDMLRDAFHGLARGDADRQSAAGTQPRYLRQADATASSTGRSNAGCCVSIWTGTRLPAGSGACGLVEPARRADVRQPPAQEPEAVGCLGGARSIDCFRVYDADMPEYAFAIDLYGRDGRHVYVQEYAAPKTGIKKARGNAAAKFWRCCPRSWRYRCRMCTRAYGDRRKAPSSTRNATSAAERHVVREGGLKFWVNFRDYLDTGLFLDHRIVRQMLREWAKDTDFLNLFCYTGSATVYAAAGGARSTTSVDLSNTYLDWAHENLLLNGHGERSMNCSARIASDGWKARRSGARAST